MGEVQHIHRQTLTIRGGGDVSVELVERRGDFTDGAVFFVLAVVVVVEKGNEAGAAVDFPDGASGGFYPEMREF